MCRMLIHLLKRNMPTVNLASHSVLYLQEISAWAMKCCSHLQSVCNEHISLKEKRERTMWNPDWGISHAFLNPWRCVGLLLSSGMEYQLCRSVEVVLVSSLHPLCLVSCLSRVSLGLLVSFSPNTVSSWEALIVNYPNLNVFPISHIREEAEHSHQAFLTVSWRMKCRFMLGPCSLVAVALLICMPLY